MQIQVCLVLAVLLHLAKTNLPLEGLVPPLELDCLGSSNSRHKLPHPCLARQQTRLVLASLVQEVSILFYFGNLVVDSGKKIIRSLFWSFVN